jgi:hypothetical protein
MDEKTILSELKKLTQYNNISLEKRCNDAIKKALKIAKEKGFTRLYIPDEGGWITYKQFGQKLKFDIVEIPTKTGIIDPTTLKLTSKDVILIHSLAGYHSIQPIKQIRDVCDKAQALFIEDCCGVPHVPHYGHILVCSFGRGKPINYGQGGFFATNDESLFSKSEIENYISQELHDKIVNVQKHLDMLYSIREELRQKCNIYSPIADQYGIILLVPFSTDEQKQNIIHIAHNSNIEYEECPRYIRTNSQAISLEIKRL